MRYYEKLDAIHEHIWKQLRRNPDDEKLRELWRAVEDAMGIAAGYKTR